MFNLRHLCKALPLTLLITSCAHSVHQVHMSDFSPYAKNGKLVRSHAQQKTIMGFVDNTDFVDRALRKLTKKCPSGNLVGISTEHMTDLGFFSWTNHIYMRAACVK